MREPRSWSMVDRSSAGMPAPSRVVLRAAPDGAPRGGTAARDRKSHHHVGRGCEPGPGRRALPVRSPDAGGGPPRPALRSASEHHIGVIPAGVVVGLFVPVARRGRHERRRGVVGCRIRSPTCICTPSSRCSTARPGSATSWPGRRGRRPARGRHHRPRQHVRGPRLLQGVPAPGRQADHRHRALHGLRAPQRAAAAAGPDRRLRRRRRGRAQGLLPPDRCWPRTTSATRT